MAISNKYNKTFNDFIYSSKTDFLDEARLINQKFCNASKFSIILIIFFIPNFLDEDFSNSLL